MTPKLPIGRNDDELLIELEQGSSLWSDALRRLKKNRLAFASSLIVALFISSAAVALFASPYAIDAVNYEMLGQVPSFTHPFGTDLLGRDLFSRCLYGLRISLGVALTATLVSVIIGVLWGSIAGYYGGKLDAAMMRFVDVLYGLPYIFFVIIIMTICGQSITVLFIAIGAVSWLTMARIVRGQVLSIRRKEFIEAAVSCGVPHWQIIARHVIPNALGPIIVYTTLTIPRIILVEAFLSFLGLGIQAPRASLGSLASDGAAGMELYPWLILFPGGLLALLVFSLNAFGDGLRDALDPRMKT